VKIQVAIIIWTIFMILTTLLGAYEIAGETPGIPIHTISFYSKHHLWLAVLIFVLVPILAIAFDVWWPQHLHTNITKLTR
jgi:hypothetical protein